MFKDKFDFKREFTTRVVESYGRSLEQSHITERYVVLGEMVREYASVHWKDTKENIAQLGAKQMYYFSMEFLMGRLLTNNLMNLGIYEIVRDGLKELGYDLNELEDLESDAGLGNGGLGRLAACFVDSLASMSLPGNGITLRYEYGFFKQLIENNKQVEIPDQWLRLGNVWEVRKPKHGVDVAFGGHVRLVKAENGKMIWEHVNAEYVRAVPCDVPVVGRGTDVTNTLRLWTAEPSDRLPKGKNFDRYLEEVSEICRTLYPDDSTEHGRFLRLKQQYFFVSAGLQALIKAHLRVYPDLTNFSEKTVLQLNDTHPVLAIPELMRLLVDVHGFEWEVAWKQVRETFAFTNHTVLSEALERWPIHMIQNLLPRIYMIIEEISRRFNAQVATAFPGDYNRQSRMSIIHEGQVHMANLAIVGSFSVNGVASLHSKILQEELFKDFVEIYPEKFNNKTNGVAHRRWLVYSNPQLTKLLTDTIGDEFIYEPEKLDQLMEFVDDEKIQKRFLEIKDKRKQILRDYIKTSTGIDIPIDSIYDTQAKRIHAYKRQLLNVLHIMYLIRKLKTDPSFKMAHQTFIFAGKAAPSYLFAKKVIELINVISQTVEADEHLSKNLKVVFIPNYSVTIAEILLNASDVSEQISTAGKEASGTGNMKFMMNGAITLGTYDGANVEIDSLVGPEDDVIFGMRVEDIRQRQQEGYSAYEELQKNPELFEIVESLIDGTWTKDKGQFKVIYEELLFKNDEYFLFGDFEAYRLAQEEVVRRYQDRKGWARTCLINIAKSGYFSSDRTINEYAREIWDLEHLN